MSRRLAASLALGVLIAAGGVPSARAALCYAVTSDYLLVRFDTGNPAALQTGGTLGGLGMGESLVGIDVRPQTGVLYLLTRKGTGEGRLYTVNPTTAAATFVATLSQNLTGILHGIDFDPVTDRLRVVSSDKQNIRVNPTTGLVLIDTPIEYASDDPNAGTFPTIFAAAYSNNLAGATQSALYSIDNGTDSLVRQNPIDGGVLRTVGPLGLDLGGNVDFDIAPSPVNHAYAAVSVRVQETDLFLIDLETGHASLVGEIGPNVTLRGFTLALGYPQTAFSRQQTVRINSDGGGYQELRFNYTTGASSVSPYMNSTAEVPRFFPFVEWTGVFHYDFVAARFTQALYASQDPI